MVLPQTPEFKETKNEINHKHKCSHWKGTWHWPLWLWSLITNTPVIFWRRTPLQGSSLPYPTESKSLSAKASVNHAIAICLPGHDTLTSSCQNKVDTISVESLLLQSSYKGQLFLNSIYQTLTEDRTHGEYLTEDYFSHIPLSVHPPGWTRGALVNLGQERWAA